MLTAERSLLKRLFYVPSPRLSSQLRRAGASRRLALRAARRMCDPDTATAYVDAMAEYRAKADEIAWIQSHGFSAYQALCALRAFPQDPEAARDHIAHQAHRVRWAGCQFCDSTQERFSVILPNDQIPGVDVTPPTPPPNMRRLHTRSGSEVPKSRP